MSDTAWKAWFEQALREGNGGDLAMLAEEAPNPASRREARLAAARVLTVAGAYRLAEIVAGTLASEWPEAAMQPVGGPSPPQRPGPPLALVFAGHMVDSSDRDSPRFPGAATAMIADAIATGIDDVGVAAGSRAFSSAAAGGDLLFAEAALGKGLGLTICLPFSQQRFLASSVAVAGDEWVERYTRVTRAEGVTVRELPVTGSSGSNAYERCNRWMVYQALGSGAEDVRGLVVWDGDEGDGSGGTAHMWRLLKSLDVPVDVIAPRGP